MTLLGTEFEDIRGEEGGTQGRWVKKKLKIILRERFEEGSRNVEKKKKHEEVVSASGGRRREAEAVRFAK
ncbi:hypothetical protein N665_1526s0001 [Sinapis alba]|nr:hypothetical protein N665_1526s0001 [Sinapis alba]